MREYINCGFCHQKVDLYRKHICPVSEEGNRTGIVLGISKSMPEQLDRIEQTLKKLVNQLIDNAKLTN